MAKKKGKTKASSPTPDVIEAQLSTRMDATLIRAFHVRCVQRGVSIKDQLATLVRDFLAKS